MTCSQCGVPVRPGQSFCGQCGTALTAQVPSPDATVPHASSASMSINFPAISFTADFDDYMRLGALAVLLISVFLPAVSLPNGLGFSLIRLGFLGWLAIVIILAFAAETAVPAWRLSQWSAIARFVSAALVGNVVTVVLMVIVAGQVLSHVLGSAASFLGASYALSVNVGFGLVLALVGSVAWAVLVRRGAH